MKYFSSSELSRRCWSCFVCFCCHLLIFFVLYHSIWTWRQDVDSAFFAFLSTSDILMLYHLILMWTRICLLTLVHGCVLLYILGHSQNLKSKTKSNKEIWNYCLVKRLQAITSTSCVSDGILKSTQIYSERRLITFILKLTIFWIWRS